MADKLEPQKVLDAIENCSVEDQQIVLQYAYETIKQLMMDAVQVVHGHWISVDDKYSATNHLYFPHRCSVCNVVYWLYKPHDCSINIDFCPSCGAKMDEEYEQK